MEIVFFVASLIACFCAIMVISQKNPVASALYLVGCMCSLAVLFVLLHAQFIAVLQIIIYAGAIMVLFLFIIMLLNLRGQPVFKRRDTIQKITAVLLSICLLVLVMFSAAKTVLPAKKGEMTLKLIEEEGYVMPVAKALFTDYLYPFELVSVLLLVAMIGVVVLAKRRVG